MKKFLALILSVAMIFALVACGSKEGDTPNTDGDTQQTDTPAAVSYTHLVQRQAPLAFCPHPHAYHAVADT